MRQEIRRLLTIRNVADRLDALSKKGAEAITKQLREEVAALRWGLSALRENYLKEVVCVVGESEFMRSIDVLRDKLVELKGTGYHLVEKDDLVLAAFPCGRSSLEPIYEIFVPYEWCGNSFIQNAVPEFAIGKKYFASGDLADKNKRGVLLEFDILQDVNPMELQDWVMEFYRSIRWDEAKPAKPTKKGEGNV